MGRWRTHTEEWLSNEQHGQDDAADQAFTQVFAAIPAVEPSAGFVQRAADAAWLARARRRRAMALTSLAASVAAAAGMAAIAYGVASMAGGWLLTAAASSMTASTMSLLMAGATLVEWWWATARAGSAVAGVVIMPQGAAALVAIELVAVAALYTLHRLLRSDVRFRNPGPLCV